jgi:hypothetical protein
MKDIVKGRIDRFGMEGQIEVRLEDRRGRLKTREIVRNTITEVFLKQLLYQGMTLTGLSSVTRGANTNIISMGTISTYGIYVMNEQISVASDTYLPPYVDNTRAGLHPSVSFYNVGGSTTESTFEMIPVDTRSGYSRSKAEFQLEFVKNSYAGVVQSVAIGRAHSSVGDSFLQTIKDTAMPANLYSTKAHYMLEHTASATIVRKSRSTADVLWANIRVKTYDMATNAVGFANITSQFGALIVNGHAFKVAKKTAASGVYTVTLTILKDWATNSDGTTSTVDINISARDGMAVDTTVLPVLVARPDQNKLEIFVTTSVGNHSGTMGANVKKVVVDISNIDSPLYETVDMGVIKYAISGFGTTVGQYMTGLYFGSKYYLPYYYVVNEVDGSLVGAASANFQEGVVLSSDFATVYNIINYRSAANTFNCPVISDSNEVIQMQVNLTTPYIVKVGQVVSGANLDAPVTKTASDVLRVIYKYKLV